jgi:phosphohistidine phosphatase
MKLYFVRHAEAIERGGGVPDAMRFLTPEGREFFRKTVKRMAGTGASPDRIVTSPLVRAVQTAEILAGETGFGGPLIVTEMLSPGFGPSDLRSVLSKCEGAKEVALVGHEPDLGELITSLLSLPQPCSLKKGEIVALKIPRYDVLSPAVFLWSAAGKKIVAKERR